jgi:TetR/AcrR family transcriptional regulator, fatty acid metabolism regulator protein
MGNGEPKSKPPGYIKIIEAFKSLLSVKDFSSITIADIAGAAGVTEPLIYKYFKDKRDLLHEAIKEHLEPYAEVAATSLKGIKGALNKLRRAIWIHIDIYENDRVLAKALMLELRNHPDYYNTETYRLVRLWSNTFLEIIEEGVRNNEIRKDISPKFIRQAILGALEHVCLRGVIFEQKIDTDKVTDDLCEFIFHGIEKKSKSQN